ncbi:hypothetical protein, partial [Nostoc sp. CALU 1950]|uniref:hypothetical protein n=1 Tax=Nostoc sp. CALU 1950 TaxID=3104321 RepID=UPI003EC0523D
PKVWFWERVTGFGLKVFNSPFPLNRQVLRLILSLSQLNTLQITNSYLLAFISKVLLYSLSVV